MDRGIIKLRALYIIILPTVNVSLSVITVCIHPGNHTLTFVQTEQHQVHKLGLMPARSTGAQWGAHSLSPSRLLRSLWWRPPPTVFITKAHTSGRQSDLCSRRQTLTIHMYVFHSTQLEPELCPFLRLWNTPVPNTGLYSPVMWAPLTHSIWPQTLRQILHWFIALTIWATDLQHKSGPGCAAEGQHTCTAYVFLPYWLCWGTLVSTNKRQWILHSAACKQQEEECNRRHMLAHQGNALHQMYPAQGWWWRSFRWALLAVPTPGGKGLAPQLLLLAAFEDWLIRCQSMNNPDQSLCGWNNCWRGMSMISFCKAPQESKQVIFPPQNNTHEEQEQWGPTAPGGQKEGQGHGQRGHCFIFTHSLLKKISPAGQAQATRLATLNEEGSSEGWWARWTRPCHTTKVGAFATTTQGLLIRGATATLGLLSHCH